MKGHISLEDFIHDVKEELVHAQRPEEKPFYSLEQVQLEISFALEAGGKAKARFVVLELGGEAKAAQTHKVVLTFKPLSPAEQTSIVAPDDGVAITTDQVLSGARYRLRNPAFEGSPKPGSAGPKYYKPFRLKTRTTSGSGKHTSKS